MGAKSKYRLIEAVFVIIFLIFNIGIPIVIASCPKIKASVRGACCPEITTVKVPIVKSQRDYSCCQTVIAAHRNTNEYLPSQEYISNIQKMYSIIPALFTEYTSASSGRYSTKKILDILHSFPLSEDIPIFTSSLLI